MTFTTAKAVLERLLAEAESMRAGLADAHARLPASSEDVGLADYAEHPVGASGLRIAMEGLLEDRLKPLLADLRAALDIPEGDDED